VRSTTICVETISTALIVFFIFIFCTKLFAFFRLDFEAPNKKAITHFLESANSLSHLIKCYGNVVENSFSEFVLPKIKEENIVFASRLVWFDPRI
jgi:hypothetical protein